MCSICQSEVFNNLLDCDHYRGLILSVLRLPSGDGVLGQDFNNAAGFGGLLLCPLQYFLFSKEQLEE